MIDPNLKAKDRIYKELRDDLKKMMEEHLLSEEEHARVLEDIKESSYHRKKTVENPRFIIVLGQTGAGKSKLTELLTESESNLVQIDSDKYKGYRKDSGEIQRTHLVEYAFLTAPDAYWHRDEMICDAMSKKYNILLECATSEKDGMFVDIDQITKMGYKVEIAVLCVSELNSLLSVHERYEDQISSGDVVAKLTAISRHDDSFSSLMKCIRGIDESKITISAYKRGVEFPFTPIQVYSTADKERKYESALDALNWIQMQDRKRTMQHFKERYMGIHNRMISRNAPDAQLEQLKIIYDRYQKEQKRSRDIV